MLGFFCTAGLSLAFPTPLLAAIVLVLQIFQEFLLAPILNSPAYLCIFFTLCLLLPKP